MDERHRQVQAWLEKVFGGESIPQYEINSRTTTILYELMIRNERNEQNTNLIIDDLQQKTDEYAAETDRLRGILQQMGITQTSLSQSGTVSLRSLANVALILDTKDASDTSLLLGLNAQTQEKLRVEEERRHEQRLQTQLFKKTKNALHTLNGLEKSLKSLEDQSQYQIPELTMRAKQAGFLQKKAREYMKNAHQLNLEVSKSGIDPSLYHHNLVTASENLSDLKNRLQPMKAKLDSYQDLPWDLSLAKVKVEEAKQELATLETELGKHINVMHL